MVKAVFLILLLLVWALVIYVFIKAMFTKAEPKLNPKPKVDDNNKDWAEYYQGLAFTARANGHEKLAKEHESLQSIHEELAKFE